MNIMDLGMKLVIKGIKLMNYWEGLVKGLVYFFFGGGGGGVCM